MPKQENRGELTAAESECFLAEQRVRECLAKLTPEHRQQLAELRSGAEINEILANVETLLEKTAAEREFAA